MTVVVSAFRRTFSAVATLLLAGGPAFAQLATPNAAGVAMGHLHYSVKDLEANRQFWTMLGGRATKVGGIDAVAFADVVVLLSRGDPAGGTDGSVVNHVAFRVPSLATVEAAGLKVQRLAQFPGVASVTTPEGERIELFENAATNLTFTQDPGFADPGAERHNRPLTVPIAFHHIHLYVPVDAVPAAKSWYSRMFGGVPGKRSNYDAVDLPGVNINISAAPKATVGTKGRMLDHIAFEVVNLAAFCKKLASAGVQFDVPFTKSVEGQSYATLTDPWGTSIELMEGLRK
jgi:catechol 2,3-dioxygenase-like lactoylglutathione lyase family enzyme